MEFPNISKSMLTKEMCGGASTRVLLVFFIANSMVICCLVSEANTWQRGARQKLRKETVEVTVWQGEGVINADGRGSECKQAMDVSRGIRGEKCTSLCAWEFVCG